MENVMKNPDAIGVMQGLASNLNILDKSSITEIKSLKSPSSIVIKVMHILYLILSDYKIRQIECDEEKWK